MAKLIGRGSGRNPLEDTKQAVDNLSANMKHLATQLDVVAKSTNDLSKVSDKYIFQINAASLEYENWVHNATEVIDAHRQLAAQNPKVRKEIERLQETLNKLRMAYGQVKNASGVFVDAAVKQTKELGDKQNKAFNESYKDGVNQVKTMWTGMTKTAEVEAGKVNKRLAEQANTFRATFLRAFSPKAMGNAIAGLIKYIGIYQLYFAALSAIKEITLGSIKAFVEFERELGNVAAVSGASRDELKKLKEEALNVAASTRFTAPQIAQLEVSLAKLGATAREIPPLIQPVALAAQALGEKLDKVGETIFKVNNQFGLSTYESTLTAQTLVSAINESALSLEQFNTAIQYVGPIAKQAGLSFQETAAYMRILADNGFTASRIGTGLRKIFVDLKETGKDLSSTLDELATQNISVKEALELVDIRAAAQLITLVRNRDEYAKITSRVREFTDVLGASAAQMATASGALDILNSAYENLKIRIGEYLYQNEILLNIIDRLDGASGRLARGYGELNNIIQAGPEVFNKYARMLLDEDPQKRLNEYQVLMMSMKELGLDTQSEFVLGLEKIQKKWGLSASEAYTILSTAITKGVDEVQPQLDELGIHAQEFARELNKPWNWTSNTIAFGEEMAKSAKAFSGAITLLRSQKEAVQEGVEVEKQRKAIVESYDPFFTELQSKALSFDAKKLKATEKQVEIQDKLKAAQEELNTEEGRGVFGSQKKIKRLQAETSAYKILLEKLSEYTEELLGGRDKDFDYYKRQFEIDKRELDIQREKIENEGKLLEEQHKRAKRDLEDRRALALESATLADKQDVLNKYKEEGLVLDEKYGLALTDINEKSAALTNKSTALFKKYNEIFSSFVNTTAEAADSNDIIAKTSVKARQALDNLKNTADGFALTMIKLNQTTQKQALDNLTTPVEAAKKLYSDVTILLDAYKESLDDLKDLYGDDAYEQVKLFERQLEYTEMIQSELDVMTAGYRDLYDAAVAQFGLFEAEKQFGPILTVLDILSKNLNKIKKSSTIDPKEADKLKKQFHEFANGMVLLYDVTWAEALDRSFKAAFEALSKFNDAMYENTKNRLDKEEDAVKDRYDREDDILKSKLDNQLISEDEYRSRVKKNRQQEAVELNRIDKARFDAEKKRDRQNATTDYLQALASIIPNLILKDGEGNPVKLSLDYVLSAALATGAWGAELAAINSRKFYPTKVYATGGIVQGPSHANGGVPFTVNGQGGYEMEGGEYVVNKRSTARYKSLLDQINGYGVSSYSFANGGIVNSTKDFSLKQIEYLEAIAEATIGTAINTSKPIRSFVTSSDLQANDNERRLKERNKNL